MKVYENSCTFDHPWTIVSAENWRKYCAWNKESNHVVAVDTLERSVDPATGILRTERIITCKQKAPRWLLKLAGSEVSYVREVSEIDPSSHTVTMRSMNLTASNFLSIQETVTYSRDPSFPDSKTIFSQEAQITAYGTFSRICNAVEDWSVERFGQNARRGKVGFEAVLEMSAKAFRDMREAGKEDATN